MKESKDYRENTSYEVIDVFSEMREESMGTLLEARASRKDRRKDWVIEEHGMSQR